MVELVSPILVRREREIGRLDDALAAAGQGKGSVLLLVGEAGSGKSRLAQEANTLAEHRRMARLWGRAAPDGVPYRPFAEAVLSAMRRGAIPDSPQLDPYRPALGRLVPDWRTGPGGPPPEYGASLVELSEALIRLLRLLGGGPGCLLVIEDLHWADAETLAVLDYLVDHLADEPVVCVATVRPDDQALGAGTLPRLAHGRALQRLDLERLDADAVDEMARACLGGPVDEAIERFLHLRADGLPLLVEELLAGLARSGAIVRQGDAWRATGPLRAEVPQTFAATVRDRLVALSPAARDVVGAAAVLGREFDWRTAGRVAGVDETGCLTALESAVDARLAIAIPTTPDRFRFRHALTRDAVLDQMLPALRVRLAGRALAAVEDTHPGFPGEWCEVAANLAEGAGDVDRAAALRFKAGMRALHAGALGTARASLEQAAALRADAAVEGALLDVLSFGGEVDAALAVGRKLLQSFEGSGVPAFRRAEIHVRMARAAVDAGRWAEARTESANASHWLAHGADPGLLAEVDVVGARIALGVGDPATARQLAERALPLAEQRDLPRLTCEALVVLGRCTMLHDVQQAEVVFGRAAELAEAHGLTVWHIRALQELGTIDLLERAATERLEDARRRAAEVSMLGTAAVLDLQVAAGRSMLADLETAMAAARRAEELGRRLGHHAVVAHALVHQGFITGWDQGRQAAAPLLARAAEAGGDDTEVAAHIESVHADLAWLDSDGDSLRRHLATGVELSARIATAAPLPHWGLWALVWTADDRDGGDVRNATRRSPAIASRLNRGYVAFADAIAHHRAGRVTEGARSLAAADEALRLTPLRWHHARVVVAEAALAGGWGDPVAWLREALACFEEQGRAQLVRSCRALLRRAGAPVPRRGRGDSSVPASLRAVGVTSRELDVLKLVAEGLSNRAIAERLHLSPRTVESHVAHLLARTSADGRAGLAELANSVVDLP